LEAGRSGSREKFTDACSKTETGTVLGTTPYTAPELIKGFEPTPAGDGYALAVMALELFTGARPHQGTAIHALLYSIVEEPPLLPDDLARPSALTIPFPGFTSRWTMPTACADGPELRRQRHGLNPRGEGRGARAGR
jgi:serine/threonine protein kinase